MATQTLPSVRTSLGIARDKQHSFREESAARPEVHHGSYERTVVSDAPRVHQSVLTREALELLAPRGGELVVDATAGAGGHSEALLESAAITLLALDADPVAVARVEERLKRFGARVQVLNANFGDITRVFDEQGVRTVHKALFDLGWNATQLTSGRGFSFLTDEPLSMSYGPVPASGFSARDILNTWEEHVLADVFFGYGEERYARRIARAVVARREVAPIETTADLVEVIKGAVPMLYRHGRLHPATRTFQALRIAVNDELGALERGIRGVWERLMPGGRIVVITFHSIEDRAVKRLFASLAGEGGTLLVKKPRVASREEVIHNPSARSAKMRAIEKSL